MNSLLKLSSFIVLAASTALADYHVIGKIAIGGDGGWDYITIDSANRRAYIAHATKVAVIDLDNEKVVGEVADTQGVHGVAFAPKLNHGYTSNGRTNDVTVFDLKTLAPIERIKTGENPDAILYDPHSHRVFTFNGRSNDSSVIDADTNKVVATIPLGGKPEYPVTDGKGHIWVNVEDTHEIAEIDTKAAKVIRKFTLEGCEDPSGLGFDSKAMHLFSVCANKVMAISDAKAGKMMTTAPIGQGADGAGFDAGMAFSSNGGDGTLTIVSEKGGKFEAATIPTERGARTMAVDPKTHKIYLPTADFAAAPASADKKQGRPRIVPGSFRLVVVGQ
jgi:YVTN family beta-propeller protein